MLNKAFSPASGCHSVRTTPMLSQRFSANFGATCRRALSATRTEEAVPAAMTGVKEKDIRTSASSNYRELSSKDRMNDYFIQLSDTYSEPLEPVDPASRWPLLESASVAQYEGEAATLNLSCHLYPHLPSPSGDNEGQAYGYLTSRGFDGLRQAKFTNRAYLAAHQSRRHYHAARQGLQGVQTVVGRGKAALAGLGVPQGVQGERDANFELWQRSCGALFSHCLPESEAAAQPGRKTLAELFEDQLAAIEAQRK